MEKLIQARVTPEIKKEFIKYLADNETSMQAVISDYVQTLLELRIPPEKAIEAIRKTKGQA